MIDNSKAKSEGIGAEGQSGRRKKPNRIGLFVAIVLAIGMALFAYSNFREAQVRASTARAKSGIRAVMAALDAYRADHGSYPEMIPLRSFVRRGFFIDGGYPLPEPLERAGVYDAWTVDPGKTGGAAGLTTPVAYLEKLPEDPFATELATQGESIPFAWQRTADSANPTYIVYSPGPDGDYDLQPWALEYLLRRLPESGKRFWLLRADFSPLDGVNGDVFQINGDFQSYTNRHPDPGMPLAPR